MAIVACNTPLAQRGTCVVQHDRWLHCWSGSLDKTATCNTHSSMLISVMAPYTHIACGFLCGSFLPLLGILRTWGPSNSQACNTSRRFEKADSDA